MTNLRDALAVSRAFFLVILSALLLPTVGCSGVKDRAWSEEVELDDGQVIVIERYVRFQESNSLAGDAYSSTDLESTVTFLGALSALPSWNAPLRPIVLYRDQATSAWVIVTSTSNCDIWYREGGPTPPYWEFRLTGNNWSRSTELSDASKGRKANLFFDYEPGVPAKFLTREIKARIFKRNYAKDYLSVMADAKSNCN